MLLIGAIYAFIPIVIIIILIAAAVGLTRGTDLFALFGVGTLIGLKGTIGAGGTSGGGIRKGPIIPKSQVLTLKGKGKKAAGTARDKVYKPKTAAEKRDRTAAIANAINNPAPAPVVAPPPLTGATPRTPLQAQNLPPGRFKAGGFYGGGIRVGNEESRAQAVLPPTLIPIPIVGTAVGAIMYRFSAERQQHKDNKQTIKDFRARPGGEEKYKELEARVDAQRHVQAVNANMEKAGLGFLNTPQAQEYTRRRRELLDQRRQGKLGWWEHRAARISARDEYKGSSPGLAWKGMSPAEIKMELNKKELSGVHGQKTVDDSWAQATKKHPKSGWLRRRSFNRQMRKINRKNKFELRKDRLSEKHGEKKVDDAWTQATRKHPKSKRLRKMSFNRQMSKLQKQRGKEKGEQLKEHWKDVKQQNRQRRAARKKGNNP